MSIIDEYRRKLSEKAIEAMNILGVIANAEVRLTALKKEMTKIYKEIDDALDGEFSDKPHSDNKVT